MALAVVFTWLCPLQQQDVHERHAFATFDQDVTSLSPVTGRRASFGDIHFGKRVLLAFAYTNSSPQEQRLTYSASSPLLTVAMERAARVPAGEQALIVIEVATDKRLGEVKEVVQVFVEGQRNPVAILKVEGAIGRYVEVQPVEGVHFGAVRRGDRIWRNCTIAELIPASFAAPRITCSPTWLELEDQPIMTREDGTRVFDYRLGIPASAPIGRFRGHVTISENAKRFDPITIPVEGEVVGS